VRDTQDAGCRKLLHLASNWGGASETTREWHKSGHKCKMMGYTDTVGLQRAAGTNWGKQGNCVKEDRVPHGPWKNSKLF